ncbi:Stringent starvation protein A homolog [Serratia proteamaculans]|uniref:glutathione S-transferase n=1 Tax=Serratia proteamaculans TaxID=28151 RepID=UPI00124A6061|nr:glutathione S-transferase [Serratia proteamaculans]KAB1493855.1 glutathione S-transferase [Serratia proteamaculans]CAI1083288.1 Stringent starvation protein A homolog [Serratia proteamaculans]CAI1098109.1 Stringent starvation protein A homolog [Serratia proteamaculans]CAI1133509.1 Stringent starvation protein A homolog [Serratia proteamaculans]
MKLIGSYTSPFVRKISVMLLEKGIAFEFVNDPPYEPGSRVVELNPLAKVPVLVAEDGAVFYDSRVIAEYLELLSVAPAFLPADRAAALRIRQVETLADGVTEAAATLFRESKRAPEKQDENWILRQRAKLTHGLDALEKLAQEKTLLNTDTLTLADIATGCALGYLNFRRIMPNWCVERPALIKLAERLFARESFARTSPP